MRIAGLLLFVSCLFGSLSAHAEKIKIGGYSGRGGHFALIGLAFETRLDLIILNAEAAAMIQKSAIPTGGTKECDVDGAQQAIGTTTIYTVFKIRSCK